jgi:hypothetical protein
MANPQLFQMLPWSGGLETSQDESMIAFNKLTAARNLVFGTQGSRKKRDGINMDFDDAASGVDSIIGGVDFWYGATARTQKYVSVTSGKKVYSYNPATGARSADLFAGTAWSNAPTVATTAVLGNLLLIAVDGGTNVVKKFDGTTVADLGGTPPDATVLWAFRGRVFANSKSNPDRLFWCATGDAETWGGTADSGGFDIKPGDGDPNGITAIFDFKGDLYVAKKTKLYRLVGQGVEDAEIITVSSALGVEGQGSVVIVEDTDVAFCSSRGFHLLSAVQTFGDVESKFLSSDIQKTFNEDFTKSRLKYVKGAYLGNINSLMFAVTDETISTGKNNALYLYNIPQAAWYQWTGFNPQTVFLANDTDGQRVYFGSNTTRLHKSLNGTPYDIDEAGAHSAIQMVIETGRISIDQSFFTEKGFKAFALTYRPDGTHTISVQVTVDAFSPQTLSYTLNSSSDLLGSTFILGTSVLGATPPIASYGRSIDGLGRAFKVRISQAGVNERAEIFGFAVMYEPASFSLEVIG